MDSVLTSLVEDGTDYSQELIKALKKSSGFKHIHLFRTIDDSFRVLLSSLKKGGVVAISALAPKSFYYTIIENGFDVSVLDVDIESGLIKGDDLEKCKELSYIINYSCYGVSADRDDIYGIGVPVIDISPSGFVTEIRGDIQIVSLEDDAVISSMGGAAILFNNDELESSVREVVDSSHNLLLSSLNSSFALSQVPDRDDIIEKRLKLIPHYKTSLYKSGYHTLENGERDIYNFFPVVLKRGLKEVQKYCRSQGIETEKAFKESIVKNIEGCKAKGARSLSNRTLLFPIHKGMGKDSVELILKVLSTLP